MHVRVGDVRLYFDVVGAGLVAVHFFGSEDFAYDWLGELDRIRCPTLILAG